MGSKCIFLNSLPHPPSREARHPPPQNGAAGILLGYCSHTLSSVIPAQAGIGLWLLLVI